ncbi:TauD/TfdA family dioxygenase [Pseudonocardia sp. HH130630-07]|uniref:TauD/TfdA family dioxygenase n=1 Tax=Pseudonocardia sp. HH130630-07 TaxID=1690815 RepID=UPI0012EB001F|nr:TauD/TfdA family dioxygenase [Pseudonocardia sp. HH130630-07]
MTDTTDTTTSAGHDPAAARVRTLPAGGHPRDWIERNAGDLREQLTATGVLRLRGLGAFASELDTIGTAITGLDTLEYHGGATPRTRLERRVYSSTDFPATHPIDLHSELAYSPTWPRYLAFSCLVAPRTGGGTPIAGTAAIADRIPARLAERLHRHGVRYRRTFHPVLGTDWRTAYGVDDLDGLRSACARRGETVSRADDDLVATTVDLPAYLAHGGREVWFNQLVAFNARTLPDEVREDLELVVGPDAIPKDTLDGAGDPFTAEDVGAVRTAVRGATTTVPWEAGDLLLVDNRRYAHGREPFTGDREVRVCMFGTDGWPGPHGAGR